MHALASPCVFCFEHSNPGFFDILITSPHGKEPRKTHLTFIVVRNSVSKSGTFEPLAEYQNKYDSVSKSVSSLLKAMKKSGKNSESKARCEVDHEEVTELDWHFVYADSDITKDQVHDNAILLDKLGLETFYGRSMASAGML